jgi:hypothetical protein
VSTDLTEQFFHEQKGIIKMNASVTFQKIEPEEARQTGQNVMDDKIKGELFYPLQLGNTR